jgi:hypothetical protein
LLQPHFVTIDFVSRFVARRTHFDDIDMRPARAYIPHCSTLRARPAHARGLAQEGSDSGFI